MLKLQSKSESIKYYVIHTRLQKVQTGQLNKFSDKQNTKKGNLIDLWIGKTENTGTWWSQNSMKMNITNLKWLKSSFLSVLRIFFIINDHWFKFLWSSKCWLFKSLIVSKFINFSSLGTKEYCFVVNKVCISNYWFLVINEQHCK